MTPLAQMSGGLPISLSELIALYVLTGAVALFLIWVLFVSPILEAMRDRRRREYRRRLGR